MRKRFGVLFGMRAVSIVTVVATVFSLAGWPLAAAAPVGTVLGQHAPGAATAAWSAETRAKPGATPPADNSGGQEQCFFVGPSCSSFSPVVSFGFVSNGDTTGCSFGISITWGDGKSSSYTFSGGSNGSLLGSVGHTYANKPGTYPIGWTSTASGNCSNSSGSLSFTLLAPPTAAEQGAGSNPSENETNCGGGDPVNCATGIFSDTFTDLSAPGRGVPLSLTRTYDSSRAGASGPLGFGWTDSYALSLAAGASGNVTITQEDGTTVSFGPNGSGGFVPPPRVEATLVKNADGSYTFTRSHGQVSYVFSAAGKLTSESDLNGYVTKLAYNSAGRLTSVTDPAGRKLSFTYSGSHITTAKDPMGRVYKYSFNAGGNLVKATDPLGRAWSFTYDRKHRLLTMTDPRGGKTSNTYDAIGRVTAQVDPDGGKTTWSYSGKPATLAGGSTTMTDPLGVKTRYQYSDLETLSVTTAAGTSAATTVGYIYDPVTLGIVSETDPDGNTTTRTYDANGNLLTSTDPLGNMTTYTYNTLNEVLTETDPVGSTTSRSYDAAGNLLSVTDPLGHSTTYAYADAAHPGDITSVTDADGHVTSYTYDKNGDVAAARVAQSASVTATSKFAYDLDGEPYCAVSPVSAASGVKCPALGGPAKPGTNVTVHDADGEPTSVTDPDGHVTKYAYNADGQQVTSTNAAGQVTSYAYNGVGNQVKVTRPDGRALTTSYDLNGDVTKQVNAAGRATTYAYDAFGRVVSATDPLGHLTRYRYDKAGHRVKLTDASGRVTTYTYDKDGRLTSVSYSDGKTHALAYTYDADGRRTSMTDSTGTTTYFYDADGRTTSVTSSVSGTVSYQFDPAGLATAITYPNGQVVSQGYDSAGELTSVSDWLGNTTTFGYDRNGSITSETYPNGVRALTSYDKADLVTSVTDKRGSTTLASFRYGRNNLGEVTSDAETGAVSATQSYSYTQVSQLASSSGGKYGYDAAGDLISQPGGEAQTFNADGQLTSTSVSKPVKSGPSVAGSWSASQLAKGSSVTSPVLSTKAGGELLVAFVSADGPAGKAQQVTSVTGGRLTWKLVSRADGQQGTAEVWQAYATKVLSKVRVTAAVKFKRSDGAITVTAFSGARSAVGEHASASRSSGGPAVSLKTSGTDSVVWAVGEDPGHATSRKPRSGQTVVRQVLDTKGKATFWAQRSGTIATSGTTVKAGDITPAGDKWNLAAVEILATVRSVKTRYAYDKTGDLIKAGPVSLRYDQAGDLTSYGNSATYAYNGDGLRMSKTVHGTITTFAWDTAAGVPLVLAAGSTYYIYGPNGQPIEQVAGTTPSYLLDDQSGSTRLITNPSGSVTGTYTYGAYGTVAKHTGTATTALQYDGQYTDTESGLEYLQARYYNPATGQFLTTDPVVSLTGEPYSFAGGDPVNLADPTGLIAAVFPAFAGGGLFAEGGLIAGCFASIVCGGVVIAGAAILTVSAVVLYQNEHADENTTTTATTAEGPACKVGTGAGTTDLTASEAAGGHTIRDHVGLSDDQLAARDLRLASTFPDLPTAQEATDANIAANQAKIMEWLCGTSPRLEIENPASSDVGTIFSRDTQSFVEPNGVTTVLWRSGSGYFVRTSYPDLL